MGLAVALAMAPLLPAAACTVNMGAGWPVATGNYGEGAANLLGGVHEQGIAWLLLPRRGAESQLVLAPDADGQWWVSRARADQRIHHTSRDSSHFGVQLRLDQQPEIERAPIPAELALRLVDRWERALAAAGLAEQAPLMEDEDMLSIQLSGQRYSGRAPSCGGLPRLLGQRVLLEELVGSKEKKHEKRYEAISRALDKYDERVAEGKV